MTCFDQSQYVSLTMEFRCNLKCVHCMIEDTMDRLIPESRDKFDEILAHNKATGQWKGIILTGSEITLKKDLPELAKAAKASGFEKIRIQTHGMHLGQPNYCDTLLESGINEFFVSVAGPDARKHDEITLVKGSFEKMFKGLQYLDQFEEVSLITNTVVTAKSYQFLPEIVNNLSKLKRLVQMEFWVYWPMSENDEKGLIASHAEVKPYLIEAVKAARALGREIEVKNFPECLLGDYGDSLLNDQPQLHIDPAFWSEFQRNGFNQCAHREQCSSQQCLGLNQAYIDKYGWESEQLKPILPSS